MRTFEEFHKEMIESHDCEKCHGKIVMVSLDYVGVTRCGYCNQVVNYPRASPGEMLKWIETHKVNTTENEK